MSIQLIGKLFQFYSRSVIKIYTLATIFECFLSHFRKTLKYFWLYYLHNPYFYQMSIDKVILDSAFLYHENIKDVLKFFDVYYKFLLNYYYNIFSFHSYYNDMSIVYIHYRLLCVLTNINICQINRLILKNTF